MTTNALATIAVGKKNKVADIPPRIFGSFVEHLGRCVYGGIYEPSHPLTTDDGFRQDVIDLAKELGVTCIRYPGGNFVSTYNWEDGTGPRDKRPVRRDLAWHCTETNEVGIDDFYRWSKKTGTEIMLAVNLGTRGLKAALEELEYVNGAAGTELADRRISNGIPEPMDIKMWCIGNEMDGPWQVGHMTPDEYASAVERVAHAMKLAESGLELVACGSSSAHMPTFGSWERTVLTKAYDNIDFVSCHAYYYERGAKTLQDYLASSHDMQLFIDTVAQSADEAKAANGGDHDIALSFDEWGVWYSDVWNKQEAQWKAQFGKGLHHDAWPKAPHLLEDIYNVTDAVVEGSLMITLLKNCNRVRSASRAQLVNAIAPIMTQDNGPAWRQTVFYPFSEAANHARGDAFCPDVDSPKVNTKTFGEVNAVDAVITWDEKTRNGLLLMVNIDSNEEHDISISFDGLPHFNPSAFAVDKSMVLHEDDPRLCNTLEQPMAVRPKNLAATVVDGRICCALPPISWSAVEFHS